MTMITPSYLGETIEYSSLHACRSTLEDPTWAMPLLGHVAAGLAALHERGIVHRDLKPSNVLVADGVARITDFGIARFAGSVSAGDLAEPAISRTLASRSDALAATVVSESSGLTRAGAMLGTPCYMAPELAKIGVAAEPAADVFAFGVIAYELLTARAPFPEPAIVALRFGRAVTLPPADGVTPELARCLALDPAERPTAAEIAAAIHDCLGGPTHARQRREGVA